MRSSTTTLHHVSLIVSDTDKSLEFYCGILELERVERPALDFPGAWLKVGGQQIHLLELPNPDSTENRPQHGGRDRHTAFSVQDLKRFRQRLDEAGIEYTMSRSGREALFCRDPDGNAIELIAGGF
ncbi:MAG: VOC family protein [Pseudomonadota bacterium]|nr:VOC family protein [Pseudomonadota bacterium]